MNFLIDAQLPPALARWIAGEGHSAVHVFDLGLQAATDSAIWDHARKSNAVIVSKDEDFVDRWVLKPEGVVLIWIRKGNCSNDALLGWFATMWPDILARLDRGEAFIELRK